MPVYKYRGVTEKGQVISNRIEMDSKQKVIDKLKETGFDVSPENLTKIVKDAASFDIDKASQDIIDAKNEQIKKLQEENRELKKEQFNVVNEDNVSGEKTNNRKKK